jgi:formyltetrahydrofolate deformylase
LSNPPQKVATLLVSCADQRGSVAAIAAAIAGAGCNILDADQHTDPEADMFFQRIRFDVSHLAIDTSEVERAICEVSKRFTMQTNLRYSNRPKRVALFVSTYDHCLVDLLWRSRAGELQAEIPLVVSNHADAAETVRGFGARFEHVPIDSANKAEQEEKELALLRECDVDLVVLARYMQVLSRDFIDGAGVPIINIHHSFLPAFIGGKPYHQAYQRGVKLIGATAHFVTSRLDEGPIIEQDVVRCSHRDLVSDLVRKGRDLEKMVLARAVRHHLEDRVLKYGNKTGVFG